MRALGWFALTWALLAIWLVALQVVTGGDWPAAATVASRMAQLAWPILDFLLWPVALLLLLYGLLLGYGLLRARGMDLSGHDDDWYRLLTGRCRIVLAWGLHLGTGAFGLIALFWAGLAGIAALNGEDPWEALPWVTPPYLEDFLARHPQLSASTFDGTRQLMLHDGRGRSVFVDGDDLAGSTVRLEPCNGAPAVSELGGLAPYPGSECRIRLSIRRGEVDRVTYVFEVGEGNVSAIERHFTAWAKARGAESTFFGGPKYIFRAQRGDERWDLWLRTWRSGPTTIYLPQGGRTLPWPGMDTDGANRK